MFGWRNMLYLFEVYDGDVGNFYVFSSGKSDLKNIDFLIEIDDCDFVFESELVEIVENIICILLLKNYFFDL